MNRRERVAVIVSHRHEHISPIHPKRWKELEQNRSTEDDDDDEDSAADRRERTLKTKRRHHLQELKRMRRKQRASKLRMSRREERLKQELEARKRAEQEQKLKIEREAQEAEQRAQQEVERQAQEKALETQQAEQRAQQEVVEREAQEKAREAQQAEQRAQQEVVERQAQETVREEDEEQRQREQEKKKRELQKLQKAYRARKIRQAQEEALRVDREAAELESEGQVIEGGDNEEDNVTGKIYEYMHLFEEEEEEEEDEGSQEETYHNEDGTIMSGSAHTLPTLYESENEEHDEEYAFESVRTLVQVMDDVDEEPDTEYDDDNDEEFVYESIRTLGATDNAKDVSDNDEEEDAEILYDSFGSLENDESYIDDEDGECVYESVKTLKNTDNEITESDDENNEGILDESDDDDEEDPYQRAMDEVAKMQRQRTMQDVATSLETFLPNRPTELPPRIARDPNLPSEEFDEVLPEREIGYVPPTLLALIQQATMELRTVPEEHKQEFSPIVNDAAEIGRCLRLKEKIIEAKGKQSQFKVTQSKTDASYSVWESNHSQRGHKRMPTNVKKPSTNQTVVGEAALVGRMKRLTPNVVKNYAEESYDVTGERRETTIDELEDVQYGGKVIRTEHLLDRHVRDDRQSHRPQTDIDEHQYESLDDVKLPTEAPPTFKATKVKLSHQQMMEKVGQAVAEGYWGRQYRLERPGAMLKKKWTDQRTAQSSNTEDSEDHQDAEKLGYIERLYLSNSEDEEEEEEVPVVQPYTNKDVLPARLHASTDLSRDTIAESDNEDVDSFADGELDNIDVESFADEELDEDVDSCEDGKFDKETTEYGEADAPTGNDYEIYQLFENVMKQVDDLVEEDYNDGKDDVVSGQAQGLGGHPESIEQDDEREVLVAETVSEATPGVTVDASSPTLKLDCIITLPTEVELEQEKPSVSKPVSQLAPNASADAAENQETAVEVESQAGSPSSTSTAGIQDSISSASTGEVELEQEKPPVSKPVSQSARNASADASGNQVTTMEVESLACSPSSTSTAGIQDSTSQASADAEHEDDLEDLTKPKKSSSVRPWKWVRKTMSRLSPTNISEEKKIRVERRRKRHKQRRAQKQIQRSQESPMISASSSSQGSGAAFSFDEDEDKDDSEVVIDA